MSWLTFWQSMLGVPFRLGYVGVRGVTTRYLEAGEPSAHPLVLVHGTGAHLEVFLPALPGLAQTFRVIAYDMVGHGLSDKPEEPYTTEVLSCHLVSLMETLGVERPTLLGHSLGALVAAWTAGCYPDRVARLILVTPGAVLDDPEVLRRIREGTLRALDRLDRESIRQRLVWLFQRPENLTEELLELRRRIYAQPGYREAAQRGMVMQEPDIRRRFAWREDWASKVRQPILLLYSRADPATPVEGLDLLRKWWPHMREEELPNTGHFPMLEDPDGFVRAVLAFAA